MRSISRSSLAALRSDPSYVGNTYRLPSDSFTSWLASSFARTVPGECELPGQLRSLPPESACLLKCSHPGTLSFVKTHLQKRLEQDGKATGRLIWCRHDPEPFLWQRCQWSFCKTDKVRLNFKMLEGYGHSCENSVIFFTYAFLWYARGREAQCLRLADPLSRLSCKNLVLLAL
jgi:hypothetical protein